MAVPINLLPPILDDMLTRGQANRPPRPWLGVFSADNNGEVVVMSVADGGPAAKAGLQRGDIISDVRDGEVERSRRFLPQGLGERAGGRRSADADRARRARKLAAGEVGRSQQLSEEAAAAIAGPKAATIGGQDVRPRTLVSAALRAMI